MPLGSPSGAGGPTDPDPAAHDALSCPYREALGGSPLEPQPSRYRALLERAEPLIRYTADGAALQREIREALEEPRG